MRLLDALSAMQAGKVSGNKKEGNPLTTVWSDQAAPGETLREYPRPQLRRPEWICLNGYWHYAFTDNGNRPEQFDGKILVPYSPECARSGVQRRLEPGKYLWYCRTVHIAEIPEKRRLLLHFGAVDERCVIWWNGRLIGSHRGGYLPFSFDVTGQIHEGKNTIWVRVQDDTEHQGASRGKQSLTPGGMFYPAQSGIWQTVWMEWVEDNFLDWIRITPLFDQGQVKLELAAAQPCDVRIVLSGSTTCYQHSMGAEEFTIRSREYPDTPDHILSRYAEATAVLDLPEVEAWTPEHPFLYRVEITTGRDYAESYFAMRKYSVGGDERGRPRLMLNNRPYFFQGVLDQGYWPESLYTPPADAAMIFDISKMKEQGFNMIRKHVKIEPLRWYYHCDRLGMMVWQDMVNGGGKINMPLVSYLPTAIPAFGSWLKDHHYRLLGRADEKCRKIWEADALETVVHLYNCPCISMWTLFNEGWGQFDAVRIAKRISTLDGTRQINHASGWFDQGGGDVRSIHNYFRPLHMIRDKRPVVLGEYGGYSCQIPGHVRSSEVYGYRSFRSEQAWSRARKKLQKTVSHLEEKGLSGAVYTQLSDVENEINGLYTYDRRHCKGKTDESSICNGEGAEQLPAFYNR